MNQEIEKKKKTRKTACRTRLDTYGNIVAELAATYREYKSKLICDTETNTRVRALKELSTMVRNTEQDTELREVKELLKQKLEQP